MQTLLRGLILTLCLAGYAKAVEIQHWERIPLAVPLTVGVERIVFVDQNVRVGVPRPLTDKLRIQSTGGALYLLASEPIAPTRLQLQNVASGEIMLVDIAATAGKPDQVAPEPIKIVTSERSGSRYGQTSKAKKSSSGSSNGESFTDDSIDAHALPRETPVPVVITRYAAQMLYAPLRTVEPVSGIAQVNLNRRLDLASITPTLPVEGSALGAWRMAGYWVTAVKLQNISAQHVTLDPRELMGDFVAVTFQHPYLGVKGEASDTTVAYVVTRGHGLAEALLPSKIARIDPKGGRREE